jgi:AbiV family abortive infection protein
MDSTIANTNAGDFKAAVRAALQNGGRLSEDAEMMLDWERFPSAYALAVLAEEEYAKAFLLTLVDAGALPWSRDVRRALRDHICKQLAAVILDYLSPDMDEFLRRYDLSKIGERQPIFPSDVLDAIHVICHERLPREWGRWWEGPSDRPLDHRVSSIADGRLDAEKQDAIYVRVGKAGEVASTPEQVSPQMAKTELERTKRIGDQLRPCNKPPGLRDDLDTEKLIAVFKLLTGALSPDDFNRHWWAQ